MTNNRDIAIIGMSCIFPGAGNLQDFWTNIRDGKDAIRSAPASRLDPVYFADTPTAGQPQPDRFYCKRGGFIDEFATFDPAEFGILPLAVEGTEPEQLLALRLAHQAIADAGLTRRHYKTGIIIGKGNYAGPGILRAIEIIHTSQQLVALLKDLLPGIRPQEIEHIKQEWQHKKGRYAPDTVMGLIPNLTASLVANRLDLQGPAYTVDAACASSLIAIDHAVKELTLGNAGLMIAGGIHASQNATFWSVFTQLGALSKTQQIRPFDRKADGLLIGEGCGFIVLQRLQDALHDGHRIYAVITGVGISSDGAGASVMSPTVNGQTKAIQKAWTDARLEAHQIGYIEAHGTGTPLGDRTELETLTGFFGPTLASHYPGRRAAIGSVKSNIGHAMPAAGIAGIIKTVMALYHHQLPPTLHCDEPQDIMSRSGFEPVRQSIDWDDTGLPKIAGVNAFGFGGINAHVVLQAFAPAVSLAKRTPLPTTPAHEKVLLLAAASQSALLESLETALHTTNPEELTRSQGPHLRYRIAVFDPTPARLQTAIGIVGRDRPWRNKQDIWFSNEALLSTGKKIAFLFPGLDGLTGGEVETVARYFGLPYDPPIINPDQPISQPDQTPENKSVLGSALRLARRTHIVYEALRQLKITPHLHAGHSVGEWFAGYAAGWGEDNDIIAFMHRLDPALFELPDIAYLMVGCAYGDLQPLLENLEQNIHLSNDNCPRQIIVCGHETSIRRLTGLLREKQVFHQLLPFRSGFHSPFLHDKLDRLKQAYQDLHFKKPSVPLWSATTLDEYPGTHQAICELGLRHLLEPVRFRELTEKLYQQDIRLFIQVGSGGLIGFIDDTLKGRSYSAIAANVPTKPGLEQLRRVLAALFAEGLEDPGPLLALPTPAGRRTPSGHPMRLALGTPLVKTLDAFQSLATGRPDRIIHNTPPTSRLLTALMDNHHHIEQTQDELIHLFQAQTSPARTTYIQTTQAQTTWNLTSFLHQLNISLESHPYLIDHSLFRQPPQWPHIADKNPVIPMTMLLELFAGIAETQVPRTVRRITDVSVLQWMNVSTPFCKPVIGKSLSPDTVKLTIEKYATAELAFSHHPPHITETDFHIGDTLNIHITPEEIYQRYMFHETAYRGIRKVLQIGSKGIIGLIQSGTGQGSLLDNAGQLYGFWLQLILPKDKVAFPVHIRELCFFGDRAAQDGVFECTCTLTSLTDELATADFLIKKEGRPWALILGWQDRRLELDDRFWALSYQPSIHYLSDEIAPGVFFFHNAYQKPLSWEFVAKRYFSTPERDYQASLSPNKKKPWTVSRIAAKDAIRSMLARYYSLQLYPVEVSIPKDPNGQPYPAATLPTTKIPEAVAVSLAHKNTDAVAIAAPHPVGIDMESIEDRGPDFIHLTLHPQEQTLINNLPQPEWITRCWVAKEAYGKYLGVGLQGSPLAYRISHIHGNDIAIGNIVITTIHYKNYIIGWTRTPTTPQPK